MGTLVKDHSDILTVSFKGLSHKVGLFGIDIIVVKSRNYKGRDVNLVGIRVLSGFPVRTVVTGQLFLGDVKEAKKLGTQAS